MNLLEWEIGRACRRGGCVEAALVLQCIVLHGLCVNCTVFNVHAAALDLIHGRSAPCLMLLVWAGSVLCVSLCEAALFVLVIYSGQLPRLGTPYLISIVQRKRVLMPHQ